MEAGLLGQLTPVLIKQSIETLNIWFNVYEKRRADKAKNVFINLSQLYWKPSARTTKLWNSAFMISIVPNCCLSLEWSNNYYILFTHMEILANKLFLPPIIFSTAISTVAKDILAIHYSSSLKTSTPHQTAAHKHWVDTRDQEYFRIEYVSCYHIILTKFNWDFLFSLVGVYLSDKV